MTGQKEKDGPSTMGIYECKDMLGQAEALQYVQGQSAKEKVLRSQSRALSSREIRELEKQGNYAADWNSVRVTGELVPERIRHSSFFGEIVLGSFSETVEREGDGRLQAGIYNSTVANCIVGSNAFVSDVRYLADYLVGENAVIFATGTLSFSPGSTSGSGIVISAGNEAGGREIVLFPDMSLELAEKVVLGRGDKKFLKKYTRFVKEYVKKMELRRGIIGRAACISHTPVIRNSLIGDAACVANAFEVRNSCIMSSADERTRVGTGVIIRDSIVQWGCGVETSAIVEASLLLEHAHVEKHAKVSASVIGPGSSLGCGEVTASLCGPLVGMHHQSLLIAAVWPQGKGNVGYGANIGSNHTSRAPDQELWLGEGMFIGLGTSIKYPADYSQAPYSVIATGVTTLPQKVSFPFSLISVPQSMPRGVPAAYQEILPAWVLYDNFYMVLRNEIKYLQRKSAVRALIEHRVLRPEIVGLMRAARNRLHTVKKKAIYTDNDIPGLGKNFLRETARKKAVEAYTRYIRYYALLGLEEELTGLVARDKTKALMKKTGALLRKRSDNARWEHQRRLLQQEVPEVKDIPGLMSLLMELQEQVTEDVIAARRKDEVRGRKIIPDYRDTHVPLEKDPVVKEVRRRTKVLRQRIRTNLARILHEQ